MNVSEECGPTAHVRHQAAYHHEQKKHHIQRSVNANSSPNIHAKKYHNDTSYPQTDKEKLQNQKKHFKKPPKISKKFPGVFGILTSPGIQKKKRNFRKKPSGHDQDKYQNENGRGHRKQHRSRRKNASEGRKEHKKGMSKKNPLLPLKKYYQMIKQNKLEDIKGFSPEKIEKINQLISQKGEA